MSLEETKRPHSLIQIGILFGLVALCLFLCLLLVKLSLPLLFGISDPDTFIVSMEMQQTKIYAALFMQSLASTWGMFLLPAIIFTQVLRYPIADFFKLNRMPKFYEIGLAILIIVLGGIFINLLVDFSKAIPLPSSLESLRNTQQNTENLIRAFFSVNSLNHFLILTIVLALLPAVAEELFFRGVLQTMLESSGVGSFTAVAIAALSFSFMHLEFDNFLAIWTMGIVLGLLYKYTQNLWIPILAHFSNNFLMISSKYAFINQFIKSDISENTTLPIWATTLSGLLMLFLLWFLSKKSVLKQ